METVQHDKLLPAPARHILWSDRCRKLSEENVVTSCHLQSFGKMCTGLHIHLRPQTFDQLFPWMDGSISAFIFCLPYMCLTSLYGHTVLQINLQFISFSCKTLNFYLGLLPHSRLAPQNLPVTLKHKHNLLYQHNLMQVSISCIPH